MATENTFLSINALEHVVSINDYYMVYDYLLT